MQEIDWSVAQILDRLVELGIDERTLVLFTSDNGGGFFAKKTKAQKATPRYSSNAPYSGGKATAAVKAKRNAEMIDEALDLQRARRGRRTREIARELAKKYRLSHKTVEPIIGPALRGSGSDAT